MAAALTVTLDAFGNPDQTQKKEIFSGTVTVGVGTYIPGGLPIDAALEATCLPKSNQRPLRVQFWSRTGSGYMYQYIKSTGNMMILQVPLTGSLTTAAPMVELLAGSTLSQVQSDIIDFQVEYARNN